MPLQSVTAAVFHEEMSLLNEDALVNIQCISVTAAVFHEEMSWLNEDALVNMWLISVTAAVFHEDCLLYTSPSPRDGLLPRMPSSA